MTSSIPYVHAICSQKQHPSVCCATTEWRTLLNDIKEIDEHIITDLDQILLYGNKRYRCDTNRMSLSTINFCIYKRFQLSLF